MGFFFRRSRAANSVVHGRISPNFEFIQALMYIIITCKYEMNLIKNVQENVMTPFLAHLSQRLIGELIVYQWSGVRRTSVRPSASSTMLKHLLLRNRLADQSHILCGASLGRGNDILFAASGSHDQDGRHAHIW